MTTQNSIRAKIDEVFVGRIQAMPIPDKQENWAADAIRDELSFILRADRKLKRALEILEQNQVI